MNSLKCSVIHLKRFSTKPIDHELFLLTYLVYKLYENAINKFGIS